MPSNDTHTLNFKITTELWERLRVAAFEARLSNSEWCRRAIVEKIEGIDEED